MCNRWHLALLLHRHPWLRKQRKHRLSHLSEILGDLEAKEEAEREEAAAQVAREREETAAALIKKAGGALDSASGALGSMAAGVSVGINQMMGQDGQDPASRAAVRTGKETEPSAEDEDDWVEDDPPHPHS